MCAICTMCYCSRLIIYFLMLLFWLEFFATPLGWMGFFYVCDFGTFQIFRWYCRFFFFLHRFLCMSGCSSLVNMFLNNAHFINYHPARVHKHKKKTHIHPGIWHSAKIVQRQCDGGKSNIPMASTFHVHLKISSNIFKIENHLYSSFSLLFFHLFFVFVSIRCIIFFPSVSVSDA